MNGKQYHSLEVISGPCVGTVKVASWVTQGWCFAVRLEQQVEGVMERGKGAIERMDLARKAMK